MEETVKFFEKNQRYGEQNVESRRGWKSQGEIPKKSLILCIGPFLVRYGVSTTV